MFHDSGEAGLGVVIRNHEGEVMASLSEKIPPPPSVTQLELLAARRELPFLSMKKVFAIPYWKETRKLLSTP